MCNPFFGFFLELPSDSDDPLGNTSTMGHFLALGGCLVALLGGLL